MQIGLITEALGGNEHFKHLIVFPKYVYTDTFEEEIVKAEYHYYRETFQPECYTN